MDKSKSAKEKTLNAPAQPVAPAGKPALFRRIDWLTFLIVTVIVMTGYWLTIAPDLTLEDCGELATGSFYAGIPHPPGYPVWTLYTYLWANFVPFHNIAWRVAMGEALAGALACGLVGLVVSRGSSMMIEGIEGLKNIDRRWENAICMVSGFVAGMLLGFNGYMWSQSVIVEVYAFSLLSFMGVLACLLRWIYTPQKRRYLYWAFFIYGICFTNHQTLIVAAMGLEVAIAAADFRMGRSLFLWNSVAYLCGLILRGEQMMFVDTTQMVFIIFNVVGVCSIAAYLAFAVLTRISFPELARDFALLAFFALLVSIPGLGGMALLLAAVALAGLIKFGWDSRKQGQEWLVVAGCGALWLAGASFYLYMALAGMSTPPMQWGYPRTVEGFIHALTRGQYEKISPTDVFGDPLRFIMQLGIVGEGVVDEFNWVYTLLALVPLLFFFRMQKRERAWMLGLVAVYLCLAVLLVVLVNPSTDRQSVEISRVIFTASHVSVVIAIGYGLTLIAASLLAEYRTFRLWGLIGGALGAALALYALANVAHDMSAGLTGMSAIQTFFHAIGRAFQPHQYGLPVFAGLLLLGLTVVFLINLLLGRERPHLGVVLAVFAIMPLHSVMSHWADNEQRNHLFGYWFGHDMFTPPFVGKDHKLTYDTKERTALMKDPKQASLIYPEMDRNAVLYGGTDPGRFCPTYMIFCESFIPPSCKPRDPNFDRRDVYIITQNALADGTYLMYIRSQYNKSAQIQYDTPFFEDVFQRLTIRDPKEREYRTNWLSKIAYDYLDKPFIALGDKIEKRRREEGVYPKNEIYIATPEDSARCFQEYMSDAQRRMQLNQLRPGEDVRVVKDPNGVDRVQVSGQVAVMAINGLLTKVMFDHNPTNEFFVEESFPLDWMYPHLTPYGIIMKINRQELPTLSEDVLKRDHEFWANYSERLIGNWITDDTPIKDIVDFVEKVYLRHDFTGFKGDLKFVRDDQAQKAFSKLRSSIAGIYAWRLGLSANSPTPPEYVAKSPAERERLLKEADFAFKQAFAFCPYSPEAVFRYMQVLLGNNRLDDAILVVQTALKLDPYNSQLADTLKRLEGFKGNAGKISEVQSNIQKLTVEYQKNPTNFQTALNLAGAYFSIGQTSAGATVLDEIVKSPHATPEAILAVAQYQVQSRNYPKLEEALERLTQVEPDSPEAWYDLAALKATLGKMPDATANLKQAIQLSDARLATNTQSRDLRGEAAKDPRFQMMKDLPEFKALLTKP
ncbi:MAG TPA: DUF2723 domain-containing protein [Verrucomicrobiae bacterium]|nr:DUF2723 domain-containing protein [Verrucomicrobiae bacterium]